MAETWIRLTSIAAVLVALTALARETRASEGAATVRLRSLYSPALVSLAADPAGRSFRSLELEVTPRAAELAVGTLWLNPTEHPIDAFGDPQGELQDAASSAIPVRLHRVAPPDSAIGHALYAVELADGSLANRLYLAWSLDPDCDSRLVIRSGADPLAPLGPAVSTKDAVALEYVIPIRTEPCPPHALDEPTRGDFSLSSGLAAWRDRSGGDDSAGRVSIDADEKGVQLKRDRNRVTFSAHGTVLLQTTMGYPGHRVRWKRLRVQDPTGAGRRVFRLELTPLRSGVPAERNEYRLVLAATVAGPHRLIVEREGRPVDVLALQDTAWEGYARRHRTLASVPDPERRAIEAIREQIADRFSFTVRKGHVRELTLGGHPEAAAALAPVHALTHLHSLTIEDCRLSARALQVLAELRELEQLTMRRAPLSDAGLAHVRSVPSLRTLSIEDDEYRDPLESSDYTWLAWIGALRGGMGRALERRPQVTDPGLASLVELRRLEHLRLSGSGITDAGALWLARLTQLRTLELYHTRVTARGRERLHAALPECRIR